MDTTYFNDKKETCVNCINLITLTLSDGNDYYKCNGRQIKDINSQCRFGVLFVRKKN